MERADENSTLLTINTSNFPAKSAFEHWQFYWSTTIGVLQRFIESAYQDTLTASSAST
jgi:hypothetical protein